MDISLIEFFLVETVLLRRGKWAFGPKQSPHSYAKPSAFPTRKREPQSRRDPPNPLRGLNKLFYEIELLFGSWLIYLHL